MYKIIGRVFKGNTLVAYDLENMNVGISERKAPEVVKMLAKDLWVANADLSGDTLVGRNGVQLKDIPRVSLTDGDPQSGNIKETHEDISKIIHMADIYINGLAVDISSVDVMAKKAYLGYMLDCSIQLKYKQLERKSLALRELVSHIRKIKESDGVAIASVAVTKNGLNMKFKWDNMDCIVNCMSKIMLEKNKKIRLADNETLRVRVEKIKNSGDNYKKKILISIAKERGKMIFDYNVPFHCGRLVSMAELAEVENTLRNELAKLYAIVG